LDWRLNPLSNSEITFKPSRYGNITANFSVPEELQLPKEYWSQLYLILLTIMIPALAGWSVPAIAGWLNSRRQRQYLRRCIITISKIRHTSYKNKDEHWRRLEQMRKKIDEILTEGKISEEQYGILNDKISEYQQDIDKSY
jgi:hypothetical protein